MHIHVRARVCETRISIGEILNVFHLSIILLIKTSEAGEHGIQRARFREIQCTLLPHNFCENYYRSSVELAERAILYIDFHGKVIYGIEQQCRKIRMPQSARRGLYRKTRHATESLSYAPESNLFLNHFWSLFLFLSKRVVVLGRAMDQLSARRYRAVIKGKQRTVQKRPVETALSITVINPTAVVLTEPTCFFFCIR